jgi:probable F420-dependent oxidoreductase
MPNPFRFGVMAGRGFASGPEWRAFARRLEELGYTTLQMPNHLADQPLAPMVALAMAAEATTDLRLGTLVLDNELVHPAVIANEAATLHTLSGGRFEFGLGAGWLAADHEPIGQRWAPVGERLERLDEALTLTRRLFTEASVDFDGVHYRLQGAKGAALADPPLFVVGGGGPRMLRIAARHADVVSLVPSMAAGRVGPESAATATGEATEVKVRWIEETCAELGRPMPELHTNVTLVRVTDDRTKALASVAKGYGLGTDDEALRRAALVPHALVGTVEEICETLIERREQYGISYCTVLPAAVEDFAPVVEAMTGR